MCNKIDQSICYTAITYEVYTFKNKNKRKSLRDIFVYHFLFYINLSSHRCSIRKAVLKNFAIFTTTCVGASFDKEL